MRQHAGMTVPALPPCVINCAAYDRNGVRRDITLDEISDVLGVDDGSFVWVGMHEPAGELLDKLQEEFGLHDLAIEDAQHAHQRPKIEAYGDSLFVVMHTAQAGPTRTCCCSTRYACYCCRGDGGACADAIQGGDSTGCSG